MRYMALDIGEVRVGIAVSDAAGVIASPVAVLPAHEVRDVAPSFKRLVQDYEPEVLVCGCPLTLAGEMGKQATRIQGEARALAARLQLPLELVDERLSSGEAKRALREAGYSEKTMRGKVDAVAACLFLQAYLDGKRGEVE